MSRTFGSYLNFFWAGLVRQGQTGALVPSQRFLVEKMIAPVPVDYSREILELGAGTGALTLRLAARCTAAPIQACEINPALAQDLRSNLAAHGLGERVKVNSLPAERLLADIVERGARKPEFIFSGIPLGNLDREKALFLIDKIYHALAPGGLYIQFQHSLLDRRKIRQRFSKLRTVPVLLNFPPAFIYFARK